MREGGGGENAITQILLVRTLPGAATTTFPQSLPLVVIPTLNANPLGPLRPAYPPYPAISALEHDMQRCWEDNFAGSRVMETWKCGERGEGAGHLLGLRGRKRAGVEARLSDRHGREQWPRGWRLLHHIKPAEQVAQLVCLRGGECGLRQSGGRSAGQALTWRKAGEGGREAGGMGGRSPPQR